MFDPVGRILPRKYKYTFDIYSKSKVRTRAEMAQLDKQLEEELRTLPAEKRKCPMCGRQMVREGSFYHCPYNTDKKSCWEKEEK